MAGNGMKGMVIEEGQRVVQQIGVRIEMEQSRIQALEAIKAVLEASWHGADSQAMIQRIEEAIQKDNELIGRLEEKRTELEQDIQEQESTSSQ